MFSHPFVRLSFSLSLVLFFYILYVVTHTRLLTFQHPKLIKFVFSPFTFIVFQPLLGAVLIYYLSCNIRHDLTVPTFGVPWGVYWPLFECETSSCFCLLGFHGRNDCNNFWCPRRGILTAFECETSVCYELLRFYILYAVKYTQVQNVNRIWNQTTRQLPWRIPAISSAEYCWCNCWLLFFCNEASW